MVFVVLLDSRTVDAVGILGVIFKGKNPSYNLENVVLVRKIVYYRDR